MVAPIDRRGAFDRGLLAQLPLAKCRIQPRHIDTGIDGPGHGAGIVDHRIADTDYFAAG